MLHYYLTEDKHNMDANVRNACEKEFLSIIRTISEELNLYIDVQVEAKNEGSIVEWYDFFVSYEGTFLFQLGTFVVNIIQLFMTKKSKTDKEEQQLRIEYLKLLIEKSKEEGKSKNVELTSINEDKTFRMIKEDSKLKKQRSNFYEKLQKEKDLISIEFSAADNNYSPISVININREDFSLFILESNELAPIEIENATIEIISPVLKKGNDKWSGIFKGEKISFSMKSNEFKTLVQIGEIEFKNGSSINCHLQINKLIDNDGNEKIKSYDVKSVNSYFNNEQPVETPEGKRNRQKKEYEKMQLNLF